MKSLLVLAALVASIPVAAVVARAETVPVTPPRSPIEKGEHPRLLLTSSTLPALKASLRGARAKEFSQFLAVIDTAYQSYEAADPTALRNLAFVLATLQMHPALRYGHSEADYEARFLTVFDATLAGSDAHVGTIEVALAYDWCFARLSPARRKAAVAYFKRTTPNDRPNPFHHYGNLWKLSYLMAGLAFKGDGIDEPAADARLKARATLVEPGPTGMRAASNWLSGSDGGVGCGWSYASNLIPADWIYHEAYRTAFADPHTWAAGAHTLHEYQPQWTTYMLDPYRVNGAYAFNWRSWQTAPTLLHPSSVWLSHTSHNEMVLQSHATSNPKMAGLARWLQKEVLGSVPNDNPVTTSRYAVFHFLSGPPDVAPRSPSDLRLPLSRRFEGLGWVSIRTGWDFDAGHTHVSFQATPYQYNNNGYATVGQGHFTISRRAPLVITPGVGAHHEYGESSWGYNTLVFADPNEKRDRGVWDRGGQRRQSLMPTPTSIKEFKPGSVWDLGGLKPGTGKTDLHDGTATHDYDYCAADLTRAYNGPAVADEHNTKKVRHFDRQLVYFRPKVPGREPDYVIVYDRTETTDPKFEQRFLLKVAGASDRARTVKISGHTREVPGPERGQRGKQGRTTYAQPALATLSYADTGLKGKMFWTPLLPSQRAIIEVGGPNASGQWNRDDSHEFEDPYGEQAGPSRGGHYDARMAPWVGGHAYELLAQAPATKQSFLNVFEPCEPSQAAATPTELLTGTNTRGVRIGTTRAAVFGSGPGVLREGTFTLTAAGTYRVLISDLVSVATVSFAKGANIGKITQPATGETGTRYRATPQGTLYVEIVVNTAGVGETNLIRIR